MKKWPIFSLCVFLFGSLLSGCAQSSSTDPNEGTSKKNGNDGEISLKFWRAGTDPLENQYWKRVISEYEEAHPNVTIELTEIPWGDEIETKLSTAFVGNTAPDVISFSIASVAARASLGHYLSLDEFIENWDGKDDLIDKVVEAGIYNGEVYGLGFIPDPRIFVWRKDFFEEAGLDPEAPPKSWEELAEFAEKLTVKEKNNVIRGGFQIRTQVNASGAVQTWQTFALQNGAQIIDAENNKATFASPEGIEAAEFLTEMVQNGVTIPVGDTDPFNEGKAAMAYVNPTAVLELITNNPELEGQIGFDLPIERKEEATFAGLRLLFMGSQTKHKEESWEFMKYVLSKEETWKRYKELGAPVVLKSLQDQYIKDDPEVNSAIFKGVTVGVGYPQVPYSFSYMELISRGLEQSYYGKKSPEEALKDAEAEFEKQLPQWLQEQ